MTHDIVGFFFVVVILAVIIILHGLIHVFICVLSVCLHLDLNSSIFPIQPGSPFPECRSWSKHLVFAFPVSNPLPHLTWCSTILQFSTHVVWVEFLMKT